MRLQVWATSVVRAYYQFAVALLVGVALMTVALGVLPATTNDVHALASAHRVTDDRVALMADRQPSVSQPPPSPSVSPAPLGGEVSWGSTELGQRLKDYRASHPDITFDRNVAVFRYQEDGKLKAITVASVSARQNGDKVAVFDYQEFGPKTGWGLTDTVKREKIKTAEGIEQSVVGKHSEALLMMKLQEDGVPLGAVEWIESEREPCESPPNECAQRIRDTMPKTTVTHNARRNPSGGYFDGELKKALRRWEQVGRPEGLPRGGIPTEQLSMFGVPGTAPAAGPLAASLSPTSEAPGGIDFSSLELRYLADSGSGGNQGLRYAFAALAATGDQDPAVGLRAAQQASDSFFVWLGLPPSKFWVNLNPNEPDRIVDAQLGRTDAGRVLLEADLQMKKTVGQLIHPDTPLGAQFWEALDLGGGSCYSFRNWIVPGPATIRSDHGALYILDAPLLVKSESDYVELRGDNSRQTACPPQQQSAEQHNEELFQALILPQLEQAVNEAPEYADLRRIYLSRIAAEWYRERSAQERTPFAGLVDRANITPWVSQEPWSPRDVFDRYVDSYTNGEFNITHQTQDGNVIETRTYIYGGVDFADVPFRAVSADRFHSQWPDLPITVERAFDQPTIDQEGTVWLGSVSGPSPAGISVIGSRERSEGRLVYLAVGAVVVGLVVIARRVFRSVQVKR